MADTVAANGAVIKPMKASGPPTSKAANRRAVAKGANVQPSMSSNAVSMPGRLQLFSTEVAWASGTV